MQPLITTMPLMQLASGDRLTLQTYRFTGAQPGKKVYLQANLHGAELTGNVVIHRLINWFLSLESTQLNGEICLVPVCNPIGVNQRSAYFASGRFNHYDGRDWNRIFWDYEQETDDLMAFAQSQLSSEVETIQRHYRDRIQASFTQLTEQMQLPSGVALYELYRYRLQSLCLDADYVIDLHTSAQQGLNYLYCFRGREASAALFLLPAAILLDRYDGDAFDEAFIKPWLALEDCFAKLGRAVQFDIEAWTLELGSIMQIKPDAIDEGVKGIQNYLVQKGVLNVEGIASSADATMRLTLRSQVKKYCAPAGGMVLMMVPVGAVVKAGQPIYQVLSFNKDGMLPTVIDICAETDGLIYDVALNQSVNEGEYVLATM